jgi:hypothetical protein
MMIPARIECVNVISSPGATFNEMYTIKPLTNRVKSPNVKRIAGSANITTIGLIIVLITENIRPASRNIPTSPGMVSDPTLGPNRRTATQRPTVFNTHLKRKT